MVSPVELTAGRGGKGVGEDPKSDDHEKAWATLHNLILSGFVGLRFHWKLTLPNYFGPNTIPGGGGGGGIYHFLKCQPCLLSGFLMDSNIPSQLGLLRKQRKQRKQQIKTFANREEKLQSTTRRKHSKMVELQLKFNAVRQAWIKSALLIVQ